ncbi:MAG: relaxase domain-containing protein [Propionibacteriaceae bacterium]|nr:relaxase domain-containing protein [Propionibacteriaceae bacterium]
MSLQRITAGSGYDYLTRQVAAMDSTEKGHTGLASYYTEKGEVPGVWMGSGMAGIDGLNAGDQVTAEQMQALFGSGHHPLAEQRKRDLAGPGLTEKDFVEITRLGQPFRVYDNDISPFRIEVARRLEALNKERGLPTKAAAAIEDRARIRSQVGLEMFRQRFGRDPLDQRELAGHLARLSRQQTTAVAGFDLTLSPVKSVSSLWAIADPALAAEIERCHQLAAAEALRFIERHALFTRTGTDGVRQVDVRGLVATGFTHRDSRAGDPDLHTHVAVANKVQTVEDGRWLSIDSRVLHKAVVAASETYNTALESHLAERVGLRFHARPNPDPRKRPVREVVGIDPELNERWSTRRRSIEARRSQLAAGFQRDHGRPPTPVEAIALAQQATLETREAKHEHRTLAEQRTAWRDQARRVLGGEANLQRMIHTARNPPPRQAVRPSQAWLEDTARQVVAVAQKDQSVWQTWHLRAEALRAVRAAEVPAQHVDTVVNLILDQALNLCAAITRPTANEPAEPAPLRRADGSSVYTVAGSQLYTSGAILAAEQRLVTAAGLHDGMVIPAAAVDLALLESEANGVRLNPGQVLLVREMAGSGVRLQLAIAPAGSGKTTAMNALSAAWSEAGGTVIGLAPSAAAAAALGENLHGDTDTLAKLIWDLEHGDTGRWQQQIRPDTLVVIDEAGMADTLSLDAAVSFILGQGASVRLIGDDQQLAAIGAGGVLRDIQATHGALRLDELLRFTDPAEGSATLALRDGHTAALGFYLDQHRVHVGDEATMTDDLFAAWRADRAGGLDAIMLAPTHELVADLNRRARTERLTSKPESGQAVELPDGNLASAGDVIITRQNNRRLRLSRTDWVKNGDRFEVLRVSRGGAITARHAGSRHTVTLPADYVAENVELGYACTTHTAQGVTADTMHGLLTGSETRQLAYTMLTRGREANHAYLVVVGDGEPHNLIRPETVNPDTPTDLLETILARDESPISATTSLQQAADPARLLGEAAARYGDTVGFAAAHLAAELGIRGLERAVDHAHPGLTDSPTWPALLSQLLLIQAHGRDPIQALDRASQTSLVAARDACTALAVRLQHTEHLTGRGPLPWLPGIPSKLASHDLWGPYLAARAGLVTQLETQVRKQLDTEQKLPVWARETATQPPAELVADIEIWRAATGVDPSDTRPTGKPAHSLAEARWQCRLDARLTNTQHAALDEWRPLLSQLSPTLLTDQFVPTLAARLSQIAATGIDTPALLHTAAANGPLPDDHAAAALWWRLSRRLTPAVAHNIETEHLATAWIDTFTNRLGRAATNLQASPWWPALVATIEHGLQRGWQLDQLITDINTRTPDGGTDPCQAWVWRLSLLTEATAHTGEEQAEPRDEPPKDLHAAHEPAIGAIGAQGRHELTINFPPAEPPADWEWPEEAVQAHPDDGLDADQILTIQAHIRRGMRPPEPTDADTRRMLEHRDEIAASPVTLRRLAHINQLAADYYQAQLPGSWAQDYLAERFRNDVTDHPQMRPGYAPDGWRSLVTHLRHHDVTDVELIVAGLAKRSERTGVLYDRFRDRAVLPVVHDGQVLGFVGRRSPNFSGDETYNPRYYNSPDTILFHKGEQLYVAGRPGSDATPVLVEGPMDAWATTLASGGRYLGVAPLGTTLTQTQTAQLAAMTPAPIVATDADLAGRLAAERDYWLLTLHGVQPRHAQLPEGTDPATLLSGGRTGLLLRALDEAAPLANALISERLANLPTTEAAFESVLVLAAAQADRWAETDDLADRTGIPGDLIRSALAPAVRAWNDNPRKATEQALAQLAAVKDRLRTAHREPVGPWEITSTNDYQGLTWVPEPSEPHERRRGFER